jgi:hypothetical protein
MPFQAGQTITPDVLNRYMGNAQPGSNDTFTTTLKVLTADTKTFTAIPAHIYEVSWNARMSATGTCVATMDARWIAGAGPITTTSTSIWSRICQVTAGNDTYHFSRTITGLAGTVTVGITGLANAGATVTAYGGTGERELMIEDLGL